MSERIPKQEQEPASEEITEVAPGILRLQLPIALPGLGHVNTYAIEDGDGFALVDPGLPGEASWKALLDRMDAAGIPMHRVHHVIVTHSHPDHFGGAGMLAEESGAEVVASSCVPHLVRPDARRPASRSSTGARTTRTTRPSSPGSSTRRRGAATPASSRTPSGPASWPAAAR